MRQRLATCAALVAAPEVLIVDEPMVGLDPHGAKALKENFKKYAAGGMTIFLSMHSLNVAEELSDRLAIIGQRKNYQRGNYWRAAAAGRRQQRRLRGYFSKITLESDYEG